MPNIVALLVRRLILGIATLLAISVLVFSATEMLPGDMAEAMLGQTATPETLAAFRAKQGLDKPAPQRYLLWLSNIGQGDLGSSLANGQPVLKLITERLENTLFLAMYAAVLAVPLAIGLAVLAALFRNTPIDRCLNVLALTSISFPEFFVAYILIFLLAQTGYFPSLTRIDPSVGFGELLYRSFLPALTLVLVVCAHMMRMTRAAIINVLGAPYIEMAKLKGVRPLKVIVRHAVPNALAPIITVVSLNLAYLITGVVAVEVVFVYPGLGQLIVDSVVKRDLPVVQAVTLVFALAYVLLNLLADVLSTVSNPRLIHSR